MCIGVPVKIAKVIDKYNAVYIDNGNEYSICTALTLDEISAGDWALAHNGNAMRKITEQEAKNILMAFEGVKVAIAGGDPSEYFSDLINKEPELPEHLK